MTEPARDRLAARQAELMRALLADGPVPPGFEPEWMRVQMQALRAKRLRMVVVHRPDLPTALGSRLRPLFDAYAQAHPRQTGTGARRDAEAFVGWLVRCGELARPRRWPWARRRWRSGQP